MNATHSHSSGTTPEAIARAIERGSAIIATMIPEIISRINCFRLYPFRVSKSFGVNSFIFRLAFPISKFFIKLLCTKNCSTLFFLFQVGVLYRVYRDKVKKVDSLTMKG